MTDPPGCFRSFSSSAPHPELSILFREVDKRNGFGRQRASVPENERALSHEGPPPLRRALYSERVFSDSWEIPVALIAFTGSPGISSIIQRR